MTKKMFQLRCTDSELARWRLLAGGNVSAWIRGVLGEECDRLEAEGREPGRRERVEEISRAFPQGVVSAAQLGGAGWKGPDPK